jgi:hypothetical protein
MTIFHFFRKLITPFMKFVILYQDRGDNRINIEKTLLDMIKQGCNLGTTPFQVSAPIAFKTTPQWLSPAQISKVPFNIQIEELEYKDDKFQTLQKRIYDAEVPAELEKK